MLGTFLGTAGAGIAVNGVDKVPRIMELPFKSGNRDSKQDQ